MQKKQIYSAFIDFGKKIDSINRDCLFYKLLKYGISGKLYYVIKAAFNLQCSVFKLKTDLLHTLHQVQELSKGVY